MTWREFAMERYTDMPRYDVAHVREQGIDLIIVPLDSSFGAKTTTSQQVVIDELQLRARSAGLAGTVVPVWDAGNGRMAFIAPRNWHPFFRGIDLYFVAANINRQLYW
jgi:hypothetical protein